MGACLSRPKARSAVTAPPSQKLHRPVWKANGITRDELARKRDEFWDTQPSYGGSQEIWGALKGACEAEDVETFKLYMDAAEVKIAKANLTQFYDSRGFLYELPEYVVSDPKGME